MAKDTRKSPLRSSPPHSMDDRFRALNAWLAVTLGGAPFRIERASTDASFRRYFRVFLEAGTLIAMDAPPERENSRAFVQVAALLRQAGLHDTQCDPLCIDLEF